MQEPSHFALSDKEADVGSDQFHPLFFIQPKIVWQDEFNLSTTSNANPKMQGKPRFDSDFTMTNYY